MLSQRSLKNGSPFILFFFLFSSSDFHQSVFQLTDLFFCLIQSTVDSFQCSFQLLYFSILFGCSLYFLTFFLKTSNFFLCTSILLSHPLIIFTIITFNSFLDELSISMSLTLMGFYLIPSSEAYALCHLILFKLLCIFL